MITYRPRPGRGVDPALVQRLEVLEARGPMRRHLLGIHAIVAGTLFAKTSLLSRSFLVGIDPERVDVDLYLVAGGGAGGVGASNSRMTGGSPGAVRVVRGLRLDEIAETMPVEIGAGALGSSVHSTPISRGGDTVFGPYKAIGGMSGGFRTPLGEAWSQISDVPLGVVNADVHLPRAMPSAGPGVGGGAFVNNWTAGGDSGVGDSRNFLAGGDAFQQGRNPPTYGKDAPAESFGYGSGGSAFLLDRAAGATPETGNAFRGGFPGGGGGARQNPQNNATGHTSGPGGNGVIRLAVYEWRAN